MVFTERQLELILKAISAYSCPIDELEEIQAIQYEINRGFVQQEVVSLIIEICQRRINERLNIGRPKKIIDFREVQSLRDQGQSWAEVANSLGLHRNTLGKRLGIEGYYSLLDRGKKRLY